MVIGPRRITHGFCSWANPPSCLSKEINLALAAPEVKSKLLDLGVAARGSTPEEMKTLLVSDINKWRGVIERAKIEKQ